MPRVGFRHSKEARKKMSERHADFRGENHPIYGKHRSNETKEKISKANKGRRNTTNRLALTGQEFGRLKVLADAGSDNAGKSLWLCRCICGNITVTSGHHLRNGNTKSCGCLKKDRTIEAKRLNLSGKKFGRLTVLKYIGNNKSKHSLWFCQCSCGTKITTRGTDLVHGRTKSCGCYSREITSKTHKDKFVSEETRQKISIANMGHAAWNKGAISSEETRKKLSISLKGRIPWNKNKKCPQLSGKNNPSYKHGLAKNREGINNRAAKRRFLKINQTPINIDQSKVQKIYSYCAKLNENGIRYEVDHIQPISKKGLHDPYNLQILPAKLNQSKHNKWPLTPEEKIKYKGITLADIEAQEQNITISAIS